MKNINKIIAGSTLLLAIIFGGVMPAMAATVTTNTTVTVDTATRIQGIKDKLADAVARIDRVVDRLTVITDKLQNAGGDVTKFRADITTVVEKRDVAKIKIQAFVDAVVSFKNGDSTVDAKAKLVDAVTAVRDFVASAKALYTEERAMYDSMKASGVDFTGTAVVTPPAINSVQ